ncbi:hypothetical protein C3L33_05016, partial [Rhododendron williamsianum]
MGGKGRKRREKNYRAAHGGNSRLPPPPKPSSVDALPSKLRAIMAFTHPSQPGSPYTCASVCKILLHLLIALLDIEIARSAVSNEKRNEGSGNRSVKVTARGVVWSVSELFIARWQLRYQVLENGRSRTDNVMPFVDIVEEVQQKVT